MAKKYEPAQYENRAAGAGFNARTFQSYDSLSIDQEYVFENRKTTEKGDDKGISQVSQMSVFTIFLATLYTVFILSS